MTQPASVPADNGRKPQIAEKRGLHRLVVIAVWIGIIVVGSYHLGLHLASLRFEEPMGSWETTYVSIARAWPDQYQWNRFIDGHDGYGPGYPTFVRPFINLGLDIYLAHRLASLVALVGDCVLLAWLLRAHRCSATFAAAAVVIFYALNAGTYSIQARPDFLVLLEITVLLALGDAVVRGRLRHGLLFDLVFGAVALCAFFTKAYGLAAWGTTLVCFGLLLGWKLAVRCGLVSGVIVAGGVALFASRNPLYVMEVFQGPLVQAAPRFTWLCHQLADFTLLSVGLIGVALAPVIGKVFSRARPFAGNAAKLIDRASAAERYWRWQTLMALVILLVGPGWHTGAYLTYFLHLFLVPLVLLAGFAVMKFDRSSSWPQLLLLGNLAVLFFFAPGWPRPDAAWAELREDVRHEQGRVAIDYLLEPFTRDRPALHLVSTGSTGYVAKEPFLIANETAIVRQAKTAVTEFLARESATLFGDAPMDTLYLDCIRLRPVPGRPSLVVSRNELPYFLGPEMNKYVPVRAFDIHPYYFSTNSPRQNAGIPKTTIVKFVRMRELPAR